MEKSTFEIGLGNGIVLLPLEHRLYIPIWVEELIKLFFSLRIRLSLVRGSDSVLRHRYLISIVMIDRLSEEFISDTSLLNFSHFDIEK